MKAVVKGCSKATCKWVKSAGNWNSYCIKEGTRTYIRVLILRSEVSYSGLILTLVTAIVHEHVESQVDKFWHRWSLPLRLLLSVPFPHRLSSLVTTHTHSPRRYAVSMKGGCFRLGKRRVSRYEFDIVWMIGHSPGGPSNYSLSPSKPFITFSSRTLGRPCVVGIALRLKTQQWVGDVPAMCTTLLLSSPRKVSG